jgi:DNA-binding NtrC family response regulator
MSRVLVIAGDGDIKQAVRTAMDDSTVEAAVSLAEAESNFESRKYDFAFVDAVILASFSDNSDYRSCLQRFRGLFPTARIVVMAASDDVRQAVNFVREGAADYLACPVHPDEIRLVRDNIERREGIGQESSSISVTTGSNEFLEALRTRSPKMTATLKQISQVAATRSTVLLTGETGTGKSLIAKVIHANSNRARQQFISVHCGAIPDTLLESELFGHERGAFTGADRRKLGKFEVAHGGTLFLDEIATISAAMQVKLLHVLQERTIQRLGGEVSIEVDVRILAATNMDLGKLTDNGSFRKDLFYRLNVFPIDIPPLRERPEDIPVLVEQFIDMLNALYQRHIREVHPTVMEAFTKYSWPGNVRELENLIERAVILETSDVLTSGSLPEEVIGSGAPTESIRVDSRESLAMTRRRAVEEVERLYLKRQLEENRGKISATARAAGITTRQLHKLMTKHGLKKEDFRPGRAETGNSGSDS